MPDFPIQVTIGLPIKEERFGKPAEVMRDVRTAIELMHDYTIGHFDPDWRGEGPSKKIQVYEMFAESGDPVKSRDKLVNNMRGNYLMMLDADTMPEQDVLVKLLEADKPIISVPMVSPTYPHFMAVFRERGDTGDFQPWQLGVDYTREDVLEGRIKECDAHGVPVLMRREVFDDIPPPWFSRMQHKVWPCLTYGHDISFCLRAREAGHKIYTHFGAIVRHAGVAWHDYSAHLQAYDNDPDLRDGFAEWDKIEEVVLSD